MKKLLFVTFLLAAFTSCGSGGFWNPKANSDSLFISGVWTYKTTPSAIRCFYHAEEKNIDLVDAQTKKFRLQENDGALSIKDFSLHSEFIKDIITGPVVEGTLNKDGSFTLTETGYSKHTSNGYVDYAITLEGIFTDNNWSGTERMAQFYHKFGWNCECERNFTGERVSD